MNCLIPLSSRELPSSDVLPVTKLAPTRANSMALLEQSTHSSARKLALALMTTLLSANPLASAGGWYLGNTKADEWIEYRDVKVAPGTYRITARVGTAYSGKTIRAEIDSTVVTANVPVPNTGRPDAFTYVYLGSRVLNSNAHKIRIYFEKSDVSLDWFMLKKSTDATPVSLESDRTMVAPASTDGPIIAPIISFGQRGLCPNMPDKQGRLFSETQLKAWYSWPMYGDYDRRTNRWWDILVDELVAARVDTCMFHCRGTQNFVSSIDDRKYGGGNNEGRYLQKLVEAINRSPHAQNTIRVSCFFENGATANDFKKKFGYFPTIGDRAFIDYTFSDWLAPWFDAVPDSYLYKINGRPIIKFYAGKPGGVISTDEWNTHLGRLRSLFLARHNLDPLFIMAKEHVTSFSNNWHAQAWGVTDWMSWNGPLSVVYSFASQNWGCFSSSSKKRIDTVWLNDWDPVTNSGYIPPAGTYGDFYYGNAAHQPRLVNGQPVLRTTLNNQNSNNCVISLEEGFTNIAEGNAIFRSHHPEWQFPNQYLGIMREFADKQTETLLFEAEACDNFKNMTVGNSGGEYRENWYTPLTNELDIYRPLHNLGTWRNVASTLTMTRIDSGFFDVWALDGSGNIWAMENDGVHEGTTTAWKSVARPGTGPTTDAALNHSGVILKNGGQNVHMEAFPTFAWALSGGVPYYATLPNAWDTYNHTAWNAKGSGFARIDVGSDQVWGVKMDGTVHRCSVDGADNWTPVSGNFAQVTVGRKFVWARSNAGDLSYCSIKTPGAWIAVPNPLGLVQIDVGAEEVWGVNAAKNIYRRSASGIGDWEQVPGSANAVTVGDDYVWAVDGATAKMMKLEGFFSP